jgi:hypothetical protein
MNLEGGRSWNTRNDGAAAFHCFAESAGWTDFGGYVKSLCFSLAEIHATPGKADTYRRSETSPADE